MITERKRYGFFGETLAAWYLKRKGYKIIERNYTTSFGEIDIIAREGEAIVFVEVKSRKSDKYLSPSANVDHKKRVKLTKLARYYLTVKNLDSFTRFDVIEVVGVKINHIKGAFYAEK